MSVKIRILKGTLLRLRLGLALMPRQASNTCRCGLSLSELKTGKKRLQSWRRERGLTSPWGCLVFWKGQVEGFQQRLTASIWDARHCSDVLQSCSVLSTTLGTGWLLSHFTAEKSKAVCSQSLCPFLLCYNYLKMSVIKRALGEIGVI